MKRKLFRCNDNIYLSYSLGLCDLPTPERVYELTHQDEGLETTTYYFRDVETGEIRSVVCGNGFTIFGDYEYGIYEMMDEISDGETSK